MTLNGEMTRFVLTIVIGHHRLVIDPKLNMFAYGPDAVGKPLAVFGQQFGCLAGRLGLDLEQDTEHSHLLAREAYDRAPKEVNCAVTYAFSLYRLGRNPEGLAIIQNSQPDQLHDQHAAVYVALLLAEASQIDGAQEYIAAAEDGKIYPEEKKLLDEAKTKLAAASATLSPAISSTPVELSPTPTASQR